MYAWRCFPRSTNKHTDAQACERACHIESEKSTTKFNRTRQSYVSLLIQGDTRWLRRQSMRYSKRSAGLISDYE